MRWDFLGAHWPDCSVAFDAGRVGGHSEKRTVLDLEGLKERTIISSLSMKFRWEQTNSKHLGLGKCE